MRKYMVIDCCENEIGEPEIFDSNDEAQICLFMKWSRRCIRFNEKEHPFNIDKWVDLVKIVEKLVHTDFFDGDNKYIFTSAWCKTDNNCNWAGRVIKLKV